MEGQSGDKSHENSFSFSLPPALLRRIKALKKLQNEWAKNEVKFYEELHQVEVKYAALANPLFDKRRDIVRGTYEPTDEECVWVDEDEDEPTGGKIGSLSITDESNPRLSGGEGDSEKIKGIPSFWLHVLTNFETLSEMIQEHDKPILKHLEDVRVTYSQSPNGFTLEFHFSTNEFFTNTVLTKFYEYDEKVPDNILDYEGSSIKQSKGCTINWHKGKNVTVKTVKKKQKHKQHGQTRVVTKTVKNDSFFNFFDAITRPTVDEEAGEEEEEDDEMLDLLEADYEIGMLIRDRVISHAVLIFTGEYADEDMDEDEDEFGEEGEEDEEEAEEEEEPPKRGGHGHGHSHGDGHGHSHGDGHGHSHGGRHRGASGSHGKDHDHGSDKV